MPHVQLNGPGELRSLREPLSTLLLSAPPRILKIQGAYLDGAEQHLILEAVVVEEYLRQNFFLLIRRDTDDLIVRCHPFSTPQKTDGVKQLIALVAQRCREICPELQIGNTNLRSYL
ncbi:MAG: hypothetical protein KAY32_04770 [Candidatus Eisenbacteria sp.]|nr:hypothetical protein [Candidatus Eisenbacteria bacterium]